MFTSVTTAYADAALVADALVILALVALVTTRFSPAARARWTAFRNGIGPLALGIAWVVAALAMVGSLYLSEVALLEPCKLCWYQRICMYPQVLLLAIATLRRDLVTARRYCLPLAFVGILFSIYHYQLERFPQQDVFSCSLDIPCSVSVVNVFNFISIPYMAMSAFALIITTLLLARQPGDEPEEAA